MFAITIPGKVGSVSVRYPSAKTALDKYHALESEGLADVQIKNAKGEEVSAVELERLSLEVSQ